MAPPERARRVLSLLALTVFAGASSAAPIKAVDGHRDALEPAKAAIRVKDYARAANDLAKLANAGDADAQYLLACLYLNALVPSPDAGAARAWLQKATAQGNSRAKVSLEALDRAHPTPAPVASPLKKLASAKSTRLASTSGALTDVQHPTSSQADLYAGWSDVAVAATRDEATLLATLLQRGADANASTPDGAPVILVAALADAPHAVETLLTAGADGSRTNRQGDTAFDVAARAGYEEVLKVLLAHGGKPGPHSDGVMLGAIKAKHDAVLQILLAAKIGINGRDSDGMTPLMLAVQGAETTLSRSLLDAGVEVAAEDHYGRTALWYAARAGSVDAARLLLDHGAKLEKADRSGMTPLAAAAGAGRAVLLDYLLTRHADVNVRTLRGDTPLLLGASTGDTHVVDKLLAAGADKDAQNTFGDTALMVASRNGDAPIVRRLLEGGASPRLRNRDRAAAVDIAEARAFPQVAQLLRGT